MPARLAKKKHVTIASDGTTMGTTVKLDDGTDISKWVSRVEFALEARDGLASCKLHVLADIDGGLPAELVALTVHHPGGDAT